MHSIFLFKALFVIRVRLGEHARIGLPWRVWVSIHCRDEQVTLGARLVRSEGVVRSLLALVFPLFIGCMMAAGLS